MKNLKTPIVLLLILFSIHGVAQTSNGKLELAVKKGLDLMSAAQTSDGFLKAANHFERIAQVEVKEWTPSYYAAYNNLVAGLISQDKTLKDQYWDKALLEVDQANAVSPDNSEIYALKGYIQFMKMSVDPQARMSFMGLSAASLGKAKALNPDNPRIYLIIGQDTFYTPEAFGGGKAKAKPLLEEAVAKFATFKAKSAIDPNWGLESAKSLLAQCN